MVSTELHYPAVLPSKSKGKCNNTTSVKTPDAVDQERHGTNTMGFGHVVAAKEAICMRKNKQIFDD